MFLNLTTKSVGEMGLLAMQEPRLRWQTAYSAPIMPAQEQPDPNFESFNFVITTTGSKQTDSSTNVQSSRRGSGTRGMAHAVESKPAGSPNGDRVPGLSNGASHASEPRLPSVPDSTSAHNRVC